MPGLPEEIRLKKTEGCTYGFDARGLSSVGQAKTWFIRWILLESF